MSARKGVLTGAMSLFLVMPGLHAASAEALHADTQKSERSYRKTRTGEGALTQKMLEACIQLKAEIEEEFAKMSASKEEFDALNREVTELSARLQKSQAQLEREGLQNVRDHNAQVELYNKKVEELKKMESAYNEKSGPYQTKAAQLKEECNGQPYYEDDYAAAVEHTGKTL